MPENITLTPISSVQGIEKIRRRTHLEGKLPLIRLGIEGYIPMSAAKFDGKITEGCSKTYFGVREFRCHSWSNRHVKHYDKLIFD